MWEIKEFSGMGPLDLGMTTSQAVAVLGEKFDKFKRVPDAKETIYAYDPDLVHLTVDEQEDSVKVISAFRPREVFYKGVLLAGRPIQDVVAELEGLRIKAEQRDGGFWIAEAGVLLVEVDGFVDGVELYPS